MSQACSGVGKEDFFPRREWGRLGIALSLLFYVEFILTGTHLAPFGLLLILFNSIRAFWYQPAKIDGDWSIASFALFAAVLPPMLLFYTAVAQLVAIRSADGVETAATILGWTFIAWLVLYYTLLPRIRGMGKTEN
jgi:hypothetical protein